MGHRIVYSSALVTPDMTLRAAPKSTRLDALLAEILEPWQLRAAPYYGDFGREDAAERRDVA